MNQEELKQRLIKLLDSVGHDYDDYVDSCHEDGMSPYESFEEFATPYLIANGVTIRERGEWIPVTEMLPDYERGVIALNKYGETIFGTISTTTNVAEYGEYCADNACECLPFVTHWMPLPLPPQEENKDD